MVTALYVECPIHDGDGCTLCNGTNRYPACVDCGEAAGCPEGRCRECYIEYALSGVNGWWCPVHDVTVEPGGSCSKCATGGASA